MRLDQFLVEKKFVQSRQRAKTLIENEGVLVNKKIIKKSSFDVSSDAEIEIIGQDLKWVSRAGLKLEHALNHWHIDVKNKVCADFGACTGGFTEVLLANNAQKVYAIDVGHDQLAEKLRCDSRVVNMEGRHLKDLSQKDFNEKIEFICIDVSFISLEKALPKAKEILAKNGAIVALIKPQFEVGKKLINKGIVKDPTLHESVLEKIRKTAKELSLMEIGSIDSPILGGKGNKEFLIYLKN